MQSREASKRIPSLFKCLLFQVFTISPRLCCIQIPPLKLFLNCIISNPYLTIKRVSETCHLKSSKKNDRKKTEKMIEKVIKKIDWKNDQELKKHRRLLIVVSCMGPGDWKGGGFNLKAPSQKYIFTSPPPPSPTHHTHTNLGRKNCLPITCFNKLFELGKLCFKVILFFWLLTQITDSQVSLNLNLPWFDFLTISKL